MTSPVLPAPPFPPRLALAAAVIAVSTGAVFVRLAAAPPLAVASFRCLFATAILAALGWRACREEWSRLSRRELYIAVATGFALALHFASWISSLSYTSVASSLVLVNTTPLWVALLSPLIVRERASTGTWLGLSLSLAGCLVIGLADLDASEGALEWTGSALWGDLLAVVGAWTAALYMLAGRRLRKSLSLVPYVTLCYGTACGFLLAFALAAGVPLAGHGLESYGWMLALAVVPQLIGHSSYNYALRYVSAASTSIVSLGESVGAVLLAWAVLAEVPSVLQLAGGVAVLAGVVLALRSERAPA
jgi:drug/metabolite transporter (DMT)-like permease